MEQDRIQEMRGLFQILEQTAEIADNSIMTQAHKNGEKRCISQFNKVLSRLSQMKAVPEDLFDTLPEDATFSEISIACYHLAAYLSEGLGISADLKNMMTNILGSQLIENIGEELKDGKIGDLIRKAMPDFLSVRNLADINESFHIGPNHKIKLDTDLGSIDIQTTEHEIVTVIVQRTAQIKTDRYATDLLKDFQVTFNEQEKELNINATFKKNQHGWNKLIDRLDICFYITLPQRPCEVILNTTVGDMDIRNLKGSVQSRTSRGSLKYENINGPIFAYTGQGDMRFTHTQGETHAETIRGNIEINQHTERVKAMTSSGNIRFTDVIGDIIGETSRGNIKLINCKGDAKIETSGGNIALEQEGPVVAKTMGGSILANVLTQLMDEWSLETTGGDITVTLRPDILAHLNAKSFGGEIISHLPVDTFDKEQKKEWQLMGIINGEGPLLKLRSIGGDIYLKKVV